MTVLPETIKTVITLTLPYPPSVNQTWRHVGNKVLLSKHGRAYRIAVGRAVLHQRGNKHLSGPLKVQIDMHPPDNRKRDADNALKSACDALQHAGVFDDDYQIFDLRIVRKDKIPGGLLYVTIAEVSENTLKIPA